MTVSDKHPGISIEIRDLQKIFLPNPEPVLGPLNLEIHPGEFVALLGSSGCGKSTLLRLIAGLDTPDRGKIEIKNQTKKHFRSYVFQDANLIPWLTAISNIALPLKLMGIEARQAQERALEALKKVRLETARNRYPAQLSGGMKMRVSIARALVNEPSLLLLDEPFSALDEQSRHNLQDELYQLWRTYKMTVIFVTHSVSEAAYLASRTIVLSNRPAHVIVNRNSKITSDRTPLLRTHQTYIQEMQEIYSAMSLGVNAGP